MRVLSNLLMSKMSLIIICPPPLLFTLAYAYFLSCSLLAPTIPSRTFPTLLALLLAIIPHHGPLLSFVAPFCQPIIFSLPEHIRPYHWNSHSVPLSWFLYHTPRSSRSAATLSTLPVQLRAPSSEQRDRAAPGRSVGIAFNPRQPRRDLRRVVVGWTTIS